MHSFAATAVAALLFSSAATASRGPYFERRDLYARDAEPVDVYEALYAREAYPEPEAFDDGLSQIYERNLDLQIRDDFDAVLRFHIKREADAVGEDVGHIYSRDLETQDLQMRDDYAALLRVRALAARDPEIFKLHLRDLEARTPGLLGAVGGGALGSVLIPIPYVGTAVGAYAGHRLQKWNNNRKTKNAAKKAAQQAAQQAAPQAAPQAAQGGGGGGGEDRPSGPSRRSVYYY